MDSSLQVRFFLVMMFHCVWIRSVNLFIYKLMCAEYGDRLKVGLKSDVYSFGVVLLQLVRGKKAMGEFELMEGVDMVGWIHGSITRNAGSANRGGNVHGRNSGGVARGKVTKVNNNNNSTKVMKKVGKKVGCLNFQKGSSRLKSLSLVCVVFKILSSYRVMIDADEMGIMPL